MFLFEAARFELTFWKKNVKLHMFLIILQKFPILLVGCPLGTNIFEILKYYPWIFSFWWRNYFPLFTIFSKNYFIILSSLKMCLILLKNKPEILKKKRIAIRNKSAQNRWLLTGVKFLDCNAAQALDACKVQLSRCILQKLQWIWRRRASSGFQ